MKEENAIVLDYLSRGYSSSYTGEAIAQAVGTTRFTLLELIPREGVFLKLEQEVYIGPNERKDIKFIKGRLDYNKLTTAAKNELPHVIENIITKNEARFLEFFNKAGPISIRKHSLELLPSIGKKHMEALLYERDRKPFTSFEDLTTRVHLMPNPVKVIQERVLEELKGEGIKYYLFTAPPKREEPRRYK